MILVLPLLSTASMLFELTCTLQSARSPERRRSVDLPGADALGAMMHVVLAALLAVPIVKRIATSKSSY